MTTYDEFTYPFHMKKIKYIYKRVESAVKLGTSRHRDRKG